MKKKTTRSQSRFPALNPLLNLKTRVESLDYDYINKLPETWTDPKTGKVWSNDDLKQYLNDFSNEFVNADFTTNVEEGRKRIHKRKKSEHNKNKSLKEVLNSFLLKVKELLELINSSSINTITKNKLKKTTNAYKMKLKKQINRELKYIKDHYKKKAESANNSRNSDVYTREKAQGKLYFGIGNPTKTSENVEDLLIAKIDWEKENKE